MVLMVPLLIMATSLVSKINTRVALVKGWVNSFLAFMGQLYIGFYIGEGFDTLIFISIAFWGIIPAQLMLTTILTQWIFKVTYEIVATPFTYLVVGFLKRRENIDAYDYRTNFSPFLFRRELPGSQGS